jgi:thioredoxin reductase (NADPH)
MERQAATDILVVGAGMAGLAAAYHAASLGASVIVLEGSLPGGQVQSVGALDDFPLPSQRSGAELADAYVRSAERLGAQFVTARATGLEADGGAIRVVTDDGAHRARRVVVAAGAGRRTLGVPGEAALDKRGISDCAWCDGGLYRKASVAVIGGGDAAAQAALHLATLCDRVTMVVRGACLRARRRYTNLVADNTKIRFIWESAVEAFEGADTLERIRMRDVVDGTERSLPFAGAFVYIGTSPATAWLPTSISKRRDGRVLSDAAGRTSMPHVYCAGSARADCSGDLASALADGARVATTAVADQRAEEPSC